MIVLFNAIMTHKLLMYFFLIVADVSVSNINRQIFARKSCRRRVCEYGSDLICACIAGFEMSSLEICQSLVLDLVACVITSDKQTFSILIGLSRTQTSIYITEAGLVKILLTTNAHCWKSISACILIKILNPSKFYRNMYVLMLKNLMKIKMLRNTSYCIL